MLRLFAAMSLFASLTLTVSADARDILRAKPSFCRDVAVTTNDATYVPGVDAYGRPVAPADLPDSGRYVLPEELTIPLTIDIAERLELEERIPGLEGQIPIGTVTLRNNQVFFNEEPVDGLNRADIVAICDTKPTIR